MVASVEVLFLRPVGRVALGAAFGLVVGAACADGARPPDSAVLVTLDTTRADALGCYGGEPGVTPALDALAEESVLFERAYATAPLTLPSHASMLTGLYPPRHSVRDNGLWPLPDAARTLAEVARDAGAETAAFVAAVVLDELYGLDQGFDHWDQPGHVALSGSSHATERKARTVVERAADWLRARDRERPFLLWVHLFDPHGPYDPPPHFRRGVFAEHGFYLGEVAAMDEAIGRLVDVLDEVGALERAALLVVADHGESWGEHGETSHGAYLWDTTMRVPFLLRHASGYGAGERSDAVVSVVDVFPTLSDAMGLAVPGGLDGASLFRREAPRGRGAYLESYQGHLSFSWNPLAGWVDAEAKYVHGGTPRLFDPSRDPGELHDLADERAPALERYAAALAEVAARPRLEPEALDATEGQLADLFALGYAAVPGERAELPAPGVATGLPDPIERTEEHAACLTAMELNNAGRFGEAARILREVVAENPDNFFALDRLAFALIHRAEWAEAAKRLEHLVARGPGWPHSRMNLGIALLEAGRPDDAVAAFRAALRLDPDLEADLEAYLARLRAAGRDELAAIGETALDG